MADETEVFKTIAGAGRAAIRALWARRDERAEFAPAEAELLALLEEHKEYRGYWDGADPEPGENPFLHISMHEVVARQLAADDPPGMRAAFERLLAAGEDAHEARHHLMRLLVHELHAMMSEGRAYDAAGYRAALDALGRDTQR